MFEIGKPLLQGNDWFVAKPALEKSLEWQYGILAIMSVLALATFFFSNSCAMFVATTAVYYVSKTAVIRQHPVLLAALVPMFIVGASATSILPVGSALRSSDSTTLVNAMALVSMAVSILYVWISGKILEQRHT